MDLQHGLDIYDKEYNVQNNEDSVVDAADEMMTVHNIRDDNTDEQDGGRCKRRIRRQEIDGVHEDNDDKWERRWLERRRVKVGGI